jgi:TetR/AcrR family transcriptional repressor of nem operon
MLTGEISQYTCLIGTTVQEIYQTHPALRAVCDRMLSEHVAMLTRDIAAAKARYAPAASWDPESVGYFTQCVLQGGFIFAKAQQNPNVAVASLGHLRGYLETLLEHDPEKWKPVLRKDRAQTKKLERDTHAALARPKNRKRKEQRS